jgi:sugar-specific transcriptional regulator TrmB
MERLETILKDMGLDGAMADTFACLAGRKRATAEEIYEDTSLSRKAVSLALAALEAQGAVKRDGMAYRMESARDALMALLPARYEELKAAIDAYRPVPAQKECPMVEAIRDEASVVPAFTARNVDESVNSVEMISRSLTWLDDNSLNAVRAAVQRGVKVRIITYKHQELMADAGALRDAGAEVRSHEYSRDVRFMVVDGEFISFAIREPPKITQPAYFGLMIRDRDVCKQMLEYIFEPAWGDAETIDENR